MEDQKYVVAEHENQQNPATNLKCNKPRNRHEASIYTKRGAVDALLVEVFERCRFLVFQVFCMTLLIFAFCHSILLAIHFAISMGGLALYGAFSFV